MKANDGATNDTKEPVFEGHHFWWERLSGKEQLSGASIVGGKEDTVTRKSSEQADKKRHDVGGDQPFTPKFEACRSHEGEGIKVKSYSRFNI